MKIKMKSGEKELKFGHKAIYKLEKNYNMKIFDVITKLENAGEGMFDLSMMYEMMHAGLSDDYNNIDDMLDDIESEEFSNYMKAIGESVGKLFGGSTKAK